jgi:hypothetical protein
LAGQLVALSLGIFASASAGQKPSWESEAAKGNPPTLGELFSPTNRMTTLSSCLVAVIALLTWWSCNAFIPVVASELAKLGVKAQGLTDIKLIQGNIETWKTSLTYAFNAGGVASRSDNPLQTALQLLFFVGFIPLLGILAMPLIIETKNRKLIS